jgi:galactonate dehydratase
VKITALETIRLELAPAVVFLRLETDEGLVGLGETWRGAAAVEAYLHETAAPVLLGEDPLRIDFIARTLYDSFVGFGSTGVETRGNSAIDVALWDLLGKVTNQPIYQLLGGATRSSIRTYNTCAGYLYNRASNRPVANWGLPQGTAAGPYEDLDAFLHRADELAISLLEQGITGMKIWPFDPFALRSGGYSISKDDLRTALEPFEKIRAAVGEKMDVMVDLHGLWRLPAARLIAAELEPFDLFWYEDPLKADDLDAIASFARSTMVPVTVGETMATRWAFNELIRREAADIIMFDVTWVGGFTEAKRIAALAESHQRPVAPHDCTGPIAYIAGTHLSLNLPNALIQESVRAYYTGWYAEVVTQLPRIENGQIAPPSGPGLGTDLQPGLEKRPGAVVRRSAQ